MAPRASFLGDRNDDIINFDNGENEYYSFDRAKNVLSENVAGDLTIIVVNMDSLPKNLWYLNKTLSLLKFQPDIIALSETHITEKSNSYYHPHMPGYKYFASTKSSLKKGSAGVFVKLSLSATERKDLDISVPGVFETVWFDVDHRTRGKSSTFGVVYRHCGSTEIPFFQRKLETVMSRLNQKNSDFYIVGDFNCNVLKYDEIPNVKSFIEMMYSNSAVNLVNKPTRFPRGDQWGTPSLLDHFYTNQPSKVKNLGLLTDDVSDHFPIVATISMHACRDKNNNVSPYIRDFRNFDNDAFNNSLSEFRDSESDTLDARFYNLHCHILSCINTHLPWRKRTNRESAFADKPWISRGLQRSILERKRLYRISRETHQNQTERIKKYNKYKKKLEKALFAAQCRYWSNKIAESQGNSKALWRNVNRITKRKKSTMTVIRKLKLDNGRVSENSVEIANVLNRYFVNVGPDLANKLPSPSRTFDSYLKNEDSPLGTFFLNPTNPSETQDVINSFSKSNCDGPDGTSPKLFKLGAKSLSVILTKMINDCFTHGYFPACLKVAKVIAIFKDGPEDDRGNWRPISITCCTSKLIEKLVKKRLIPFLKRNNIISKYQFGYRSNHSTTHAILNISDNILQNFDKKKNTVSIFLDLSKGFDCVDHKILLKKLHHYGIRGVAHDFFKSYLTNRQQYTLVDGVVSQWLTVLCGVPQGSVLGPLLFLLYTNDLSNASDFQINLFADDTCLSLSHSNINVLRGRCNAEAARVNEWFIANRLTTNSKKASNYLLSEYNSNDSNRPVSFNIVMGNVNLRRVNTFKYLGVMLDENVTWSNQVEHLSTKLSRSAGIFFKIALLS